MSLHAKFSQLLRWKFVNDRQQNDLVVGSKSIIICHLNEKKKSVYCVCSITLWKLKLIVPQMQGRMYMDITDASKWKNICAEC